MCKRQYTGFNLLKAAFFEMHVSEILLFWKVNTFYGFAYFRPPICPEPYCKILMMLFSCWATRQFEGTEMNLFFFNK